MNNNNKVVQAETLLNVIKRDNIPLRYSPKQHRKVVLRKTISHAMIYIYSNMMQSVY